MKETLDLIFREDGVIKEFKEDYIPRPSQIEGAHILGEALMNSEHAILEGPCGFGKTFGYLAPLFEAIAKSGFNKKAVIVTNGISLQEQLFYKDIPLMKQIFKKIYPFSDFRFCLLKGKQNFICNKKIADLVAENYVQRYPNEQVQKILDFSFDTSSGDLSDLDFVPSYDVLELITCNKQGECTGRKCPNYEGCWYQKYRKRCLVSNVIVTNYHMLFSDSQTAGAILPQYDILVCDEAHEMGNIYRDFLGYKISAATIKSIRNDISEILNKDKKLGLRDSFEMELKTGYLVATAERYFQDIRKGVFKQFEDIKLLDDLTLESEVSLVDAISMTLTTLSTMRAIINDEVDRLTPFDNDFLSLDPERKEELNHTEILLQKTGHAMEELEKHLYVLNEYKEQSVKEEMAWWIEKEKDRDGKDTGSSSLNYRPVKVGEDLTAAFFNVQGRSVILTSATLSVGGNFDYIKEETGLNLCQAPVKEYIGQSPFDLKEQQLWYLPEDAIDGNTADFDYKFIVQLEKIIKHCSGGVLCLFTSIKNMNKAYNELKYSLPYTLLKQGMKPRMQLIDEFKEDTNSVLLATKSFFTGVDVPGDALRCVIIDKFPFPSPSDPVMQKLSKDKNSFFKYFIPMMVIDLKQAVGRGVRSITDKCVVAILDGRMSTARYKQRINQSFNYEKKGTRSLDDIPPFLGLELQRAEDGLPWDTHEDDDDIPF